MIEPLPEGWKPPEGWDIADAIDEGWTPEAYWAYIEPRIRAATLPAPYEAPPTSEDYYREPPAEKGGSGGGGPGDLSVEPLTLDPKAPVLSAQAFMGSKYQLLGYPTLLHHGDQFYRYNGRCWREIAEVDVRAEVYMFLHAAARRDKDDHLVAFSPNRSKVGDVLDAIKASANLSAEISAPYWLHYTPDCCPPPWEVLASANGLLHLPERALLSATPSFYTHNAVEFGYDPAAPEPAAWFDFLNTLWPDDPQSIATLQEIFGYLLTPDTSQQKLFMLIGPKRSGKGTIGRVMTALLGQGNVVSPTLASLCTNFGLQPLIGKQLAIIGDARLSQRHDQAQIAERLLSVSGEDGISVDRKHREAWTGRLGTRFVIISNELPRLADASGALASRFIVLTMDRSFYGVEDHGLTDRLLGELPGILNWAIEGWQRLRDRGRFIQPEASRDAVEEMEALGSPVFAFVDECCEIAPGAAVEVGALFEEWKKWCESQGRRDHGTKQTFGRDLRAVVPGVRQSRPRGPDGRKRFYEGIRLKPWSSTVHGPDHCT
jgi:putative DNA primase/helicase